MSDSAAPNGGPEAEAERGDAVAAERDHQPSLAFDDPRHLAAHRFLVEEAAILDARRYEQWLGLLTDDIRYVMPVRVTTSADDGWDELATMAHFDENHYSLTRRVRRLGTRSAWTEDPPSRTRHLVTNVRTNAGDGHGVGGGEIRVESSLLLFRSRGDDRPAELLCAERHDILREVEGELRLAHRRITIEESVLRTQNLAIFL